jgi:hypothetical protein
MRVLHIDRGRAMRGGQWQVLHLLRGLRERGIEAYLDSPADSPLAQAAREFIARTRRMSFDILHAHDARSHTVALLRGSGPVVVSRRVAFPPGRGLISRWKYRRASHFIAISHCVAGTLLNAGLKPETISVVYDGVPIPPYREPAEDGPVLAIENEDTQEGTELLRRAAKSAGIEVAISPNLSRDLARASSFAYITRLQGLGSAALMAMASGVPVIASRAGGLVEVIEDGVTGLLVENSQISIVGALERVLRDRPFAQAISIAAYERVAKDFSADAMVDGTLAVYRRVLG